jgi:membrane protease YdiL (CAAX protease family)
VECGAEPGAVPAGGLRPGEPGWALLYGAALRIPLGTAVPEEVIFRGVLLGALERRTGSWWTAAWWSSAVFGLWHVGPTIVLARVNGLDGSAGQMAAVVAGAVAATTVAGLGFCLLRRWGRGVVAPAIAHAATNGLSLLAAVAAQRASG